MTRPRDTHQNTEQRDAGSVPAINEPEDGQDDELQDERQDGHPRRPRRARVTTAEMGTQADIVKDAWSEWDLGRALPLLFSKSLGIARRILRKMHIRFWHCPVARMRDLLTVAGAPSHVVDQVQSIVDTCRICRS